MFTYFVLGHLCSQKSITITRRSGGEGATEADLLKMSLSPPPRETAGWLRAQALENQIIEHLFLPSWKVNGGDGGRFNNKLTVTVAPSLSRKNLRRPKAQAPEDKIIVYIVLTPRKVDGASAQGKIVDRMVLTFWKVGGKITKQKIIVVDFLEGQRRWRKAAPHKRRRRGKQHHPKGGSPRGATRTTPTKEAAPHKRREEMAAPPKVGNRHHTAQEEEGGPTTLLCLPPFSCAAGFSSLLLGGAAFPSTFVGVVPFTLLGWC